MALNDDIKVFVSKLVTWSSEAGKELAELDDDGLGSGQRARELLLLTKDVMEVIDALYVTDITLEDEDGNEKLNYLQDTDVAIYQLMDSWNHHLKLDVLPAGYLPLENEYFVLSPGGSTTVSVGDGLPSGGGQDFILGQNSLGEPTWIRKPTLFELDETT
jgi:hypothetical protein